MCVYGSVNKMCHTYIYLFDFDYNAMCFPVRSISRNEHKKKVQLLKHFSHSKSHTKKIFLCIVIKIQHKTKMTDIITICKLFNCILQQDFAYVLSFLFNN